MVSRKFKIVFLFLWAMLNCLHTPSIKAGTPPHIIQFDENAAKTLIEAFTMFGKYFTLSLKDIPPIHLHIDAETIDRLISLTNTLYSQAISFGKFSAGFVFVIMGGLVIKNGCQSLGDKEKERAAYIQIASGSTMTLAGLLFMYMQGSKIPTQLQA